MIKAVIFDMDGLMFDTERLCVTTWDSVGELLGVGKLGYLISKTLGLSWEDSRQVLLKEVSAIDCEKFRNECRAFTHRYFEEFGVPIKSGLFELLEFLRQNNYKAAVASSSTEASVRHQLKLAGVEKYFSFVICGDMIAKSKPEPEIFLKACEGLTEKPENCLVLEDSRNGLLAALAAGCPAIMIPDLWPGESEIDNRIDAKLDNLADVIDWLQNNS